MHGSTLAWSDCAYAYRNNYMKVDNLPKTFIYYRLHPLSHCRKSIPLTLQIKNCILGAASCYFCVRLIFIAHHTRCNNNTTILSHLSVAILPLKGGGKTLLNLFKLIHMTRH